jgi:hypothetical protein
MSSNKFDIFISYHFDSKDIVKKFFDKLLTNFNYKLFMYETEKEDDQESINARYDHFIIELINDSKCFICFLTDKYAQSIKCKSELKQAAANKLQIFLIQLKNIDLKNFEDLKHIVPLAKFDFYNYLSNNNSNNDDDENDITNSSLFNLLKNSIEQLFIIKSYLLSDLSNSNLYLKNRKITPIPSRDPNDLNYIRKNNSNNENDDDDDDDVEYDYEKQGKYFDILNENEDTSLSTNGRFMRLSNGDLYNGKFLNKQYFGYGIYKWTNGESYEGDWFDGQRTGTGIMKFINGDIYEGNFFQDRFLGYGKYTWKSTGNYYEGDWIDGQRTGQGVYFYIKSGDRYEVIRIFLKKKKKKKAK